MLNKKSGLLGLSGVSSDMREMLQAADEGNLRALIALKAFCYRVRKYIGAYVASMGGLDAVIFTGGIGQGSAVVRALALQGLECMGITLTISATATRTVTKFAASPPMTQRSRCSSCRPTRSA